MYVCTYIGTDIIKQSDSMLMILLAAFHDIFEFTKLTNGVIDM